MYKILIVDDEKSVRYSFRKLLKGAPYSLYEAENYESAMETLHSERPDLAIIDIEMPGKNGLDLLKVIQSEYNNFPVIMVTAFGSGDRVIKAMKHGAYDYIEKPFNIPHLLSVIKEALKTSSAQVVESQNSKPNANPPRKPSDEIIIGDSPAIKEVFKLIGRVAATDVSILITGESGTGKELVAKAIHNYSDRAGKPFVAVNCAAIPETLLESELFGYEKGAFTGATRDKPGKFDEANGGTLFLDEIGDMSLPLQSKLLRVLQEGQYERLGSTKTLVANARIITATNANLETMIRKKDFREDLFYRIRVITIALPPLRLRKEDIPALVTHFMEKHKAESRIGKISIQPEAMEQILGYNWPGNIRQLENTIKRAVILAKGNLITPEIISMEFDPAAAIKTQEGTGLESYLTDEISQKSGEIYDLVLRAVEKDMIRWALNKTEKNQAKTATLLGISRVMLRERINKFNINLK